VDHAPGFSVFIDISEQINVKLQAVSLYKSKGVPPPGIRSIDGVRALAKPNFYSDSWQVIEMIDVEQFLVSSVVFG
jgi:hypothetical protein